MNKVTINYPEVTEESEITFYYGDVLQTIYENKTHFMLIIQSDYFKATLVDLSQLESGSWNRICDPFDCNWNEVISYEQVIERLKDNGYHFVKKVDYEITINIK